MQQRIQRARGGLGLGAVIAGSIAAALGAAACEVPSDDARPADGLLPVSIGADALATAQEVLAARGAALRVHGLDATAAVLALTEGEIEALSEAMHARHGRCGGLMLHESLAEALAAPAAPAVAVDYTLDRAAAVGAVLPLLDAERIAQTIRELSSMKNRYYRSESGAAASAWLLERWRADARVAGRADVTVELWDHGYPQRSVVLTIPGAERADEVVVLGGHLDSIALGGAGAVAPGADDDASGIATLTEVARALLVAEIRPARTLKLIAYAAEEVGLRGSLAIARDLRKRGVAVVGALQLDMTNYHGSDRDIWIIDDFTSPAQNAFLVRLIEAYVGATWGHDVCGYACSDHASWHRAGVPASMPFEARSRDRNQAIHTRHDTLERSGEDARHAVKFARLAAAYAIELGKTAGSPPPPARRLAPASVDRAAPEAQGAAAAAGGRCAPGAWLAAALGLALASLLVTLAGWAAGAPRRR
jgi:leucyl aminopeptidase